MNGRDFLDVAYDLLGGTREADWRSAASRGYYAGFHCARDLLAVAGFAVPSEHAHVYLWRRLSNCGHADIREAGLTMADYRRIRNWADYTLTNDFDQDMAGDLLRNIDDIIRLLEALPSLPETYAKVIEQIRTYERDVLREETWGK